jgi:CBS domain-containing protein
MFSVRIRNMMEGEKMVTAPPQTTVSEAAALMASYRVGALMVVDDGALVGIFTERDAVFRVLAPGLDAKVTRLAEVMTPAPVTVDPERSFGHALQLMHEHGFRHVPVVENGKPVGIVSARDALDPEMEDFVCEAQRREGIR